MGIFKSKRSGKKIDPVNFVKDKNPAKLSNSTKCPVCGLRASRPFLNVQLEHKRISMMKCSCGSLYYPGQKAPDYAVVEGEDSFYMRIDQAEGIDSIIMPLFLSPRLRSMPVVDIGCGMGFGTDFLRFLGREVVAFDPSAAAKMSGEILGIDIQNQLAEPGLVSLGDPRLVFASEVIEHVENPLEFVETMKSIAGDLGYGVITTPNAEYVNPGADKSQVMAMLAPSQHLFLASPSALVSLARQAGFKWATSYLQNDRLFLICGPTPLEIEIDFKRSEYQDYLHSRLNSPRIPASIRYRCFGYRLLKELVNAGKYEDAELLFEDLAREYSLLGIDLYKPNEVAYLMKLEVQTSKSRLSSVLYPFNLGIIFSLVVTIKIALHHDKVAAAPFARAAIQIGNLYQEMFEMVSIFSAYDLEVQQLSKRMLEQINLHSIRI
jgi:SAM-dependent methyltransferase